MPKKKQDETPKRTALVMTKEQFGAELNDLIQKGKEIHERQINNTDELELAKREYYNWVELADELLKCAFNEPNNEYRHDFDQEGNTLGLYDALNRNIDTNHPTYRLNHLRKQCDFKVNNLGILLSKIKYMPSEIESARISDSPNDKFFSEAEKLEMHEKIDSVLEKLHELHLGQEIIFNEIEELKTLLSLDKKNWKQVLKGKLVDLGLGKIVDVDTLEWIYNRLTDENLKLLGS